MRQTRVILVQSPDKWEGCITKGIRCKIFAKSTCGCIHRGDPLGNKGACKAHSTALILQCKDPIINPCKQACGKSGGKKLALNGKRPLAEPGSGKVAMCCF